MPQLYIAMKVVNCGIAFCLADSDVDYQVELVARTVSGLNISSNKILCSTNQQKQAPAKGLREKFEMLISQLHCHRGFIETSLLLSLLISSYTNTAFCLLFISC